VGWQSRRSTVPWAASPAINSTASLSVHRQQFPDELGEFLITGSLETLVRCEVSRNQTEVVDPALKQRIGLSNHEVPPALFCYNSMDYFFIFV